MGSSVKASYCLGLVFILGVAVIWACASVLIQYIYSSLHFTSPYLLTSICTSLLSCYLPWLVVTSKYGWNSNPPWKREEEYLLPGHHLLVSQSAADATDLTSGIGQHSDRVLNAPVGDGNAPQCELYAPAESKHENDAHQQSHLLSSIPSLKEHARWSHVRTIRISSIILPFFFVANLSYNVSLAYTSVTSNTIISTTSSLWTFLFSTLCHLERFTWLKLLGLVLCLGGSTAVGLSDGSGGSRNTIAGDLLCVFAAMMYGVYTTLMRVLIPDDQSVCFQLLFGYMGLIALIFLTPITLILMLTLPQALSGITGPTLGFILINGLCNNVLSDYLWARAIVLTSSTVATVGLSLTIPFAFISDTLLGKGQGGLWKTLGALAVAAGFVMVSYRREQEIEEEKEMRAEGEQQAESVSVDEEKKRWSGDEEYRRDETER